MGLPPLSCVACQRLDSIDARLRCGCYIHVDCMEGEFSSESEVTCPRCQTEWSKRSSFFYWRYSDTYPAVLLDVLTYRLLGLPWTTSWERRFDPMYAHFSDNASELVLQSGCQSCHQDFEFKVKDIAVLLPCRHMFHATCIAQYFVTLERGNVRARTDGKPAECLLCQTEVEGVFTAATRISRVEWKRVLSNNYGLIKIDFSRYHSLPYTYTTHSQDYNRWSGGNHYISWEDSHDESMQLI
jgi:hypothetical protein